MSRPPGPGRSRVALEPTELDADGKGWTEAGIFIDRDEDADGQAEQLLLMTPAEMAAVYQRLSLYYRQGTWSSGIVQRVQR